MHLTPDKEAAVASPVCCRQRLAWFRPPVPPRPSFIGANISASLANTTESLGVKRDWLISSPIKINQKLFHTFIRALHMGTFFLCDCL